MEGHVEEVISEATRVELSQFIKSICALVDLKSGWNTSTWSIIQHSHYVQEDGFNCGIIICLFAEYLSQNLDINAKFDMRKVRQHVTSTIMGSCYDDIYERNSLVCKICKIDDGEDGLGCHSCGQYFHASCLNVDFGQTLTEYFACP
ncbi:uncharacterized protein LOC124454515 [Xenia sp. Carnegie-2017]|uniref:uncharacterized protein LOC124454515 n=1 Tax=Xenia sp. Carnegie-2017 TaxID=2897299 RepID=UPI001F036FE0|nr:uncharacterized protein LOC124454515 [Xenia sp. Carnegie-2017]